MPRQACPRCGKHSYSKVWMKSTFLGYRCRSCGTRWGVPKETRILTPHEVAEGIVAGTVQLGKDVMEEIRVGAGAFGDRAKRVGIRFLARELTRWFGERQGKAGTGGENRDRPD